MREEVGRHVGAKRHSHVGSLNHLGSVDGIVGAVVEIIDISWYSEALGDIGEVLVLGTCYNLHLADKLGLLDGIGSPCTGLEISSLGLQQIERHHIELEAGATAEEEDLVTLGNIEQLLHECISLIDNSLEFLGTVRDLKDGEASACEVLYCLSGLIDSKRTQNRGSSVKVVLFHTFKFIVCLILSI